MRPNIAAITPPASMLMMSTRSLLPITSEELNGYVSAEICADAHEARVTERQLAEEADDEVQGDGEDDAVAIWTSRVDAERWRLPVSWRMTDTPRTTMTII